MSVFNDLVDTIVKLEQEYSSYCEWKCTRVETRVPTYLALKYIRPVGNQAVAGDKERRKAMSFRRKLSSVHLVQPPCGEAVPVFDDNPTRMSDVTAHRDVYDEILGRRRLGAVDWKLFCSACLRQVESTFSMDSPETLGLFVPSVKREEQQMLKDRNKALEFVNYLFDIVDQGGSVAYRNRLSGVKSAGNAGFRNEDTFGLFWTVSSCDMCLTGKDSTTPADATVSECVDSDMREAIISALRSSFDVDLERAKQLVAEVTSMGVISRSNQTDVEKFLKVNKHTSWRSAHVKMGNCDVDIYYRGEEQRRTESGVYTFRGPISFSEYVNMRAYCAGEELYYNPPPLDSDEESGVEEEEEEEENEEEEEEEEEDYDGIDWEAREKIKEEKRKEKMERRLKKREKVEEAPYVDVVNVAVTTLRRRCVYEDLLRRLNSHRTETKLDQQLFASGPGACCVSQEVQWMFTDDGCAIEVRRIVANTRQVECCVSSPGGLEFGFLTLDTAPQEGTLLLIPCGLRCYFTVVDEVQFFFEVLADNSDAVAQMAYETAQENARRDAKVHRGMLESIKPSKNSKEKVVVPPLNVIEEEFISKIPPPVIRGKKPPVAQTTFLLQNGTIGAFHLNEQYLWLSVPWGSLHTTIANLSVDVWNSNKVRTARVNYIERIEVFSDGCLGIRCPEIRGFRVSLDTFGNYVTMDSGGALVRVDMFGNRTLVRPCGEVVNLEPIHVSTLTDSSSGRRVIVRQDGTQIILRYDGSLESLVYGAGLSCTRSGERFTWHVAGFPSVFVSPTATQVGLSFNSVEAVMDTNDNELRIVDHRGGSEALLKWKIHRLYVKPMVGGNTYTLDCAFGGLIGRSNATEYCVSTLGRCGNAREDVFNSPEVLSQQFLAYFEETSSKYEAAQLHRTISDDVVSFLLESPSTGNSSYTRASASCYGRFVNSEIEKLIPQGAKPCADMFRIVVRKHADSDIDSSILFFGGVWLSKLLMDRLKTYVDSTYVYPLAGASVNGKIVEERVLFLQAAKKTVTERGTMTPIAKSVADFLLIPSLPQSMLSTADDERDVLHVVLPKPEVPLSTTDVMDLLCIGRLVACEDNAWNEALKALPPSELTTLLPRNGDGTTPDELHTHGVQRPTAQHPKSPYTKPEKHKGKFNYWSSTGISIAADRVVCDVPGGNECYPVSAARTADVDVDVVGVKEARSTSLKALDGDCIVKDAGLKKYSVIPFMHSHVRREIPPQERLTTPKLSVTPRVLDFGPVEMGYRYMLPLNLTNTSIFPCRYRITAHANCKTILQVRYKHHFLAPGLTTVAEVELLGAQPPGRLSTTLSVAFEGGSTCVEVLADTAGEPQDGDAASSSPALPKAPVVLLGPLVCTKFVPGTTRRETLHARATETEAGANHNSTSRMI
uniref:Uncharacterized protein TCIL3000_11_6570 n=1 Tax=Trypanosoma congolense (strain IL3000) TaxID=1068625 RepID=G0V0R0_TRYCI|nr:unnamed protein product [Trypanosoma congolense IL3000]